MILLLYRFLLLLQKLHPNQQFYLLYHNAYEVELTPKSIVYYRYKEKELLSKVTFNVETGECLQNNVSSQLITDTFIQVLINISNDFKNN